MGNSLEPNFVEHEGQTYALVGNRVLASGNSLDEVEQKVAEIEEKVARQNVAEAISQSTHVETPNGIKGKIVSRSTGLWGDSVTVRLANGRVVSLEVSPTLKFTREEDPRTSKLASIEAALKAEVSNDIYSLTRRRDEMTQVHKVARNLILQGASHSDEQKLADYAAQALLERHRVSGLIDEIKLAEVTNVAPPEPEVVEQASLGGHETNWLDDVINDIEAETAETDLDQFMNEGPEAFAAQVDEGMINDPEGVRELAMSHVQSKVAFVAQPHRDQYTELWLSRLEECRQKEAKFSAGRRPQEQKTASAEVTNAPDEGLFL